MRDFGPRADTFGPARGGPPKRELRRARLFGPATKLRPCMVFPPANLLLFCASQEETDMRTFYAAWSGALAAVTIGLGAVPAEAAIFTVYGGARGGPYYEPCYYGDAP